MVIGRAQHWSVLRLCPVYSPAAATHVYRHEVRPLWRYLGSLEPPWEVQVRDGLEYEEKRCVAGFRVTQP